TSPAYPMPPRGMVPPGYNPMAQGMPNPMAPAMYPPGPYGMVPAMPQGMQPAGYLPQPALQQPSPDMLYVQGPAYLAMQQGRRSAVEVDDPYQRLGNLTPPQLLFKLRESLYPSQRELAADQLARLDWKTQPQIVSALLLGAREDQAATVRAGCV